MLLCTYIMQSHSVAHREYKVFQLLSDDSSGKSAFLYSSIEQRSENPTKPFKRL